MIKLYTDIKYASDNIEWIYSNDALFNSKINANQLNSKDLQLMNEIEGLTLNDKTNSLFNSPTGMITIDNISTGLKTLLNIRWLKRQGLINYGVNITECGPNILDYVFEEVSDGSICVLLNHWDVLSCKDRYIEVNGTQRVKTMKNLFNLL